MQIYLGSETVVNWGVYLCGVKKIVQNALTETITTDQDCIAIKDWLYYYEVLARFGVMHWSATPEKYPICYAGPVSKLIRIDADGLSLVSAQVVSAPILCLSKYRTTYLQLATASAYLSQSRPSLTFLFHSL